jgi:hypothetical protein
VPSPAERVCGSGISIDSDRYSVAALFKKAFTALRYRAKAVTSFFTVAHLENERRSE